MTRRLMIKILASFFLVQGLWDIGSFFAPIFTSPTPISLSPFNILVGAIGVWAGIYLLQLSDFGRKFAITLLSLRVAINLGFTSWVFLQDEFGFSINFFGKPIFELKGAYPFAGIMLVWSLVALGAILFLGQRKTKAIFTSGLQNTEKGEPVKSDQSPV